MQSQSWQQNHPKMGFIKGWISMQHQRGALWLALIDIIMSAVIVQLLHQMAVKKKKKIVVLGRERKPWPRAELRSPCVQFLDVMKCSAVWNWPNPGLQKQFGKMEEELAANELKGSRNSIRIGQGELTCPGFTLRQWCRRKRMKPSGTAGRLSCRLLGYNYTLIKRSCLRHSHTFHISFWTWLLIIKWRSCRLTNTAEPFAFQSERHALWRVDNRTTAVIFLLIDKWISPLIIWQCSSIPSFDIFTSRLMWWRNAALGRDVFN